MTVKIGIAVELAKDIARRDIEAAQEAFAAIASEIRKGQV